MVQMRSGCSFQNFSENETNHCFNYRFGNFYDICEKRCYVNMQFASLHSDELENVVYGLLFPMLVFFVVTANVLVAIVLSRKHMITPTNVVLKYMAIADLCVGLVPLPWTFFYHSLGNHLLEDHLQLWWCYMYKYSMDAVPPVCHNIAMWLTVLLAGQRYISVEYPMQSRTICSVRNVRLATLVITLISLLCGLPKSFDFYYEVYEGWALFPNGDIKYLRSCLSGFTALVRFVGPNAFFNCYFWTRVIGFIMLPSMLLIILNILLIRGIRKAQKRKQLLVRENRAREAQRQTDNNSTSLMLVVIVSIFLIVNLPQALFMGLLCVCTTFGLSLKLLEGFFPTAFLLANNMLVMATYPINFGIYCFMSSSFRRTFKTLFNRFFGKFPFEFISSVYFARLSLKRRVDEKTAEYRSNDGMPYDMTVSSYNVIGVNSRDTVFL